MCRAGHRRPLLLILILFAVTSDAKIAKNAKGIISFGPWLTIKYGHAPPAAPATAAAPAEAAAPATAAAPVKAGAMAAPAAAAAPPTTVALVAKPSSTSAAVKTAPAPSPAPVPQTPAATTTPGTDASAFPVLSPTRTPPPTTARPPQASAAAAGHTDATSAPLEFKQPGATKTIKVGCALPLTGQKADVGVTARYGISMALEQLLKQELPSTNVILQCEDSKCLDVPAFNAVSTLAKDPAVIGVVGEICSGASVAAASRATQLQLPVISPTSTASSLSEADFFFRVVPPDEHQAAAIADRMFNQGHRKAGVVYAKTTYGWGLALNFVSAFTGLGGKVLADFDISIPTSATSKPTAAASQAVAKLKAAGVDSVFIASNQYQPVADFLKAAKAAGLAVPLYAGDGVADDALLQLVAGSPSAIDQLTVSQLPGGPASFVTEFKSYTPAGTPYRNAAALAYDATSALLRAYKAAAAPKNGAAVIKQLGSTDFQGLTSRIKFDANGDLVLGPKPYSFARFDLAQKALLPIA